MSFLNVLMRRPLLRVLFYWAIVVVLGFFMGLPGLGSAVWQHFYGAPPPWGTTVYAYLAGADAILLALMIAYMLSRKSN
jgi:hypothetical protein